MHPATQRLLRFFSYSHLPDHLQVISKPFCSLANDMADNLPANAETAVSLRKLLESKDCAVRALLEGEPKSVDPKPPA